MGVKAQFGVALRVFSGGLGRIGVRPHIYSAHQLTLI